jgi:hypothetical protein
MRALTGIVLVVPLFPGLGFAQGSATPGSTRHNAFTRGTYGEPAVLPPARIVLHGPVNNETQSDAKGAFAIDSLPPRSYDIEASAPDLSALFAAAVSTAASSTDPVEMNVAAVRSTTSTQLTQLEAMHCASSRKMHRYA